MTDDTPPNPARTIGKTFLALLLATLGTLPCSTAAAMQPALLDYFIREPDLQDRRLEAGFGPVVNYLNNESFKHAEDTLSEFLAANETRIRTDHESTWHRLRVNLGILKSLQQDYEGALSILDESINGLQRKLGRFDQRLFDPLMARALVREQMEMYEEAEHDLRWAQNIVHRHQGVYSVEQLPVLEELSVVNLKEGEMLKADRQQRFYLKIYERRYGRESVEILPVLQEIALYFARRGDQIPLGIYENTGLYRDKLFRDSVELYRRAIGIIETNYGPDDIRLIEPLRGLARARILQITQQHLAEEAMERATRLILDNPDSDVPDRARALVDLADTYMITGDGRAEETYLKAWNLLAGDSRHEELRNQLFGAPKRLYPESFGVIVLDRQPEKTDEDTSLYVNVEYTVRANGRVSDVKVIDGNVPNESKRSVRYHLAEAHYRPRIVDGEFVHTDGLMLHQPFRVEKPEPVTRISVSSGPTY